MFERLFGWKKLNNPPKWIGQTRKMRAAHRYATHRQGNVPLLYHLTGKNYYYRIKVRSTGQYAFHTVYSKRRKR